MHEQADISIPEEASVSDRAHVSRKSSMQDTASALDEEANQEKKTLTLPELKKMVRQNNFILDNQ
mgnify:CR=1 FL=1